MHIKVMGKDGADYFSKFISADHSSDLANM
jgi:hypothetical protein